MQNNQKDQKSKDKLELIKPEDLKQGKTNTNEDLQLQADVINVYEKRIEISEFSPERQKQIKNYYRFSALPVGSLAASAHKGIATRSGK